MIEVRFLTTREFGESDRCRKIAENDAKVRARRKGVKVDMKAARLHMEAPSPPFDVAKYVVVVLTVPEA